MKIELTNKMTIPSSNEFYVIPVTVKDANAPWKEFCLQDKSPREYLIIEPVVASDPLKFDTIPDVEIMSSERNPVTYCTYRNINHYYNQFVSLDDIDDDKMPISINTMTIHCFENDSYKHIPFSTFTAMVNIFKHYLKNANIDEYGEPDISNLTIILNATTNFNIAPKKALSAMCREIAAAFGVVFNLYEFPPTIFVTFSENDAILTCDTKKYDSHLKKKNKKNKKKKSKKGHK